MERVRSGDPSEQDAAISALLERVRRSRDRSDVPILARALLEARRFDNAIGILDKLIKAFPNEKRFRLDRAIANLSRQDSSDGACNVPQRADCLLRLVAGDDRALREPALAELRGMVEEDPQDSSYRLRYGFALMLIEDREGAARVAEMPDSVDDPSYSFHLSLSQIFYYCGDTVKGRAHLELAVKNAIYDQDRITARKLIADLEKR
jgi:tetratricopeptide (TPR) repeat protein